MKRSHASKAVPSVVFSESYQTRFFSKVNKTEECWLWSGATLKKGYGHTYADGAYYLAHRISFVIAGGTLEPGDLVLHRCDVPNCVRPDHLYKGNKSRNALDAYERGLAVSNNKLKTSCEHGHKFDVKNTRYSIRANGKTRRTCRKCDRIRMKLERSLGKRKTQSR